MPLVILQPGHSTTIYKDFFYQSMPLWTRRGYSGQEEVMLPLPLQQKNQETEGEGSTWL